MFKIFRCVLAIIALQLIILSAALAAGTQTTALSTVGGASPAYTDLGAAPLQVQAIGGDVKIIIADSGATPSLALAGNVLFQGQYQTFNPASATSHVWAIGLNGAPSASYSPIYASTPIGSVTQGTSPWVVSGNVSAGQVPETCVTPTVTASNAYGTNYVVGGLLTFNNVASSTGNFVLESATVTIKDVESSGFTLSIFRANPSNTTWTDAAAAAINAADKFSVAATFAGFNTQSVLGAAFTNLSQAGLGQPVSLGSSVTTVYGILTSNAALTNNFAGTGDVKVCIGVLQAP